MISSDGLSREDDLHMKQVQGMTERIMRARMKWPEKEVSKLYTFLTNRLAEEELRVEQRKPEPSLGLTGQRRVQYERGRLP